MPPQTGRCPNCFGATAVTPCSHCGWQVGQDNPPPALALGRVLDGRYRVGRVLGHGGFGITYLVWDDNLQLRLAIKEYLPRDCVSRGPDGVSLAVYSGQAGDQFAYGLDRFLEEARTLAHFDQHPGIVTVKNFFRAHGTGYCVMDYVAGITLRQYLDQQPGGRISVADALKLLTPVMDALRAVHKEGLLHRDLAPDNIYLTQDGRIKLLDFGAARFAASEHSKSLSIILKPGYAPEEQYRTRGKQGPWTDVYGLAATCYRAITGQVPPEALDRLDHDDLVPPSRLGIAITPGQEAVLLQALAVKAGQRFQDMAELQAAWRSGSTAAPQPAGKLQEATRAENVVAATSAKPAKLPQTGMPPSLGGKNLKTVLFMALGAGVFILAVKGGLFPSPEDTQPPPALSGGAAPSRAPPPVAPSATPPAQEPVAPQSPAGMGAKVPLYFAAASAPTANIPPEAPLCYKFMVAGPEEQLRKLKAKYPGLYDDQIATNLEGGQNLIAKRRDEQGEEITYFYSTSPGVCNAYQQVRLQTPAPPEDQAGANAPTPSAGNDSPSKRYRFLGKGQNIVEDTRTKLQWQRCSLGQTWNGATCAGLANKYDWHEAQRVAPAGWRLPTKEEFASLIYCSSGEPAYWQTSSFTRCTGAYESPTILEVAFPYTPENWFWSSSPDVKDSNSAWFINFGYGGIYSTFKSNAGYIRLLRSGK